MSKRDETLITYKVMSENWLERITGAGITGWIGDILEIVPKQNPKTVICSNQNLHSKMGSSTFSEIGKTNI